MTKAYRKEKERELRRNDIIDAAEDLFFKDGFENVSMNQIAEEAEMARATLYQYFKNKNDIYAAIAIRGTEIMRAMFNTIPQDLTGLETLKTLSRVYYQFYKEHPGYYKAYYHTAVFDHESSPNIGVLEENRKENFRVAVEAMEKGFKDGTIRDDINPVTTTFIMLSMSNHVNNILPVTQLYMDEYGFTQDQLFESNLELVVSSIENKKKHE